MTVVEKERPGYQAIDVSVNIHLPEHSYRLLPLGLYKAAGPTWIEKIRAGWPPEYMLEMMDRSKVQLSLVISLWCANGVGGEELYVAAEEMLPMFDAHPGRFLGLVGISPIRAWSDRYYGPRYIERMVVEHGFKGVHMYPHWFGIRIDDPRMYPIFEKCVELDVPISFQTGQGTMRSNSRIVARPIWIDNIARDFPALRIVALHSGYPWEEELVALAINHENTFICPDVPPPRMWHSAIVEYLKEEGRFEGLNGSSKVLWATDWPLQDQETSLKEIDDLGLAPQIRRNLVRDNAIRIFKLGEGFRGAAVSEGKPANGEAEQ
jgi:predicted TIM-barrel fold metal-dependent hydrolase